MDLRRITDFDAPELDVYARLTENQLLNRADPQNALFVAESPLVIGRALDAGCEPVSFLMETKHVTGKGAALLARCPGVPVYAAEEDVLTNLTGRSARRPQSSSSRTPSWNLTHEKIRSRPISPVFDTCVPQHAQISAPGMVTMRTCPVSSFLLR